MPYPWIDDYLLQKPSVTKDLQPDWNWIRYQIGGKLFAAVCLDDLDVTDVVVPVLCEGQGTVRCQHGVIPVPVPAVVNVVAAHGIPLRILDVQGELVTPTGAALVAAVRTRSRLPERFVVERVGVGAGKRAYDTPGVLRALVVREDTE